LTKVAEKIIAKESREWLWRHITELNMENSRQSATTTELQGSVDSSTETITTQQRSVDAGIKDYNLLLEGNKSMLVECDALCNRSKDFGV
jgi:hypothetical protein